MTEKLLEVENETMMKVADLEKILLHKDKELQVVRVSVILFPLSYRESFFERQQRSVFEKKLVTKFMRSQMRS